MLSRVSRADMACEDFVRLPRTRTDQQLNEPSMTAGKVVAYRGKKDGSFAVTELAQIAPVNRKCTDHVFLPSFLLVFIDACETAFPSSTHS